MRKVSCEMWEGQSRRQRRECLLGEGLCSLEYTHAPAPDRKHTNVYETDNKPHLVCENTTHCMFLKVNWKKRPCLLYHLKNHQSICVGTPLVYALLLS